MELFSNTAPKKSEELLKHFSDTYFALRIGLALLAFTMPFVLYFYGKYQYGLDLQPSMSAYFWAAGEGQCATFPMRTIFVGFLFAIAVGLYVYKGLTILENTLLNLAAIAAALVAIYPERITVAEASCPAVKEWAELSTLPIHLIAAVMLFVFLAIVAWKSAHKSLEYLSAEHNPETFRYIYKGIAIAMVLFPFTGVVWALLAGIPSSYVFFIEAAGVLTFGLYWVVKSYELYLSKLESDTMGAVESFRK